MRNCKKNRNFAQNTRPSRPAPRGAGTVASMNALTHIQHELAADIDRLKDSITHHLATTDPLLQAIINQHQRNHGKMIRATLVLLCARMLGQVNHNTIDAAAAIELLHNGSLIHDDVIDNSPMRRGQPTVNALWDNNIAVLVGDYYVTTATRVALLTRDFRIIDALITLGKELTTGELDQIFNVRDHILAEDAFLAMVYLKTSVLFKACALMASYAQDIDDERTSALARYAELLGTCFQLRDDNFDYFPAREVGKPTGNDLREGKITLPLLHVLLNDQLPDHDAMVALATAQTELDDGQIATLQAYARDHGGIEYAYGRMHQLRDQAVEALSIFPPSQTRQWLTELFDFVIERKL